MRREWSGEKRTLLRYIKLLGALIDWSARFVLLLSRVDKSRGYRFWGNRFRGDMRGAF